MLTVFTVSFSISAEISKDEYLGGKHIANGIGCADCHGGEENPESKGAVQPCLDCHGGYSGMAEATQKEEGPNPHDSHEGEIPCNECHQPHQPSVDYCEQCHTFSFKVP